MFETIFKLYDDDDDINNKKIIINKNIITKYPRGKIMLTHATILPNYNFEKQ